VHVGEATRSQRWAGSGGYVLRVSDWLGSRWTVRVQWNPRSPSKRQGLVLVFVWTCAHSDVLGHCSRLRLLLGPAAISISSCVLLTSSHWRKFTVHLQLILASIRRPPIWNQRMAVPLLIADTVLPYPSQSDAYVSPPAFAMVSGFAGPIPYQLQA